MTLLELQKKLKDVRQNARKMQVKWLSDNMLYDQIIYYSASIDHLEKVSTRDRIDFILYELADPRYCSHCQNILKHSQNEFCSAACIGKSEKNKKSMSEKQKANSKERMQKTRKTNLQRYGCEHTSRSKEINAKRKATRISTQEKKYKDIFDANGLDYQSLNDANYVNQIASECTSLSELSEKYFANMHVMFVWRHLEKIGAKKFLKQSSAPERELSHWIKNISNSEVILNDRKTISPYELDIFIPDLNLAIEFNGIFWHSTAAGIDDTYHKMKTNRCNSKGITLLHFSEADWISNTDICKSMIMSKMKLTAKVHARKLKIVELTSKQSDDFFQRTHISGNSIAKYRYALVDDLGQIKCAATFSKSRFSSIAEYELIRFANELDTTVVGGFSKLVSHFKKSVSTSLMTYCDKRYSIGNVYSKNGKFVSTTSVGYEWIHMTLPTLSRYQTQKNKLKTLLGEKYDDKLSEDMLMKRLGYFKHFNCGNDVFTL